MAAPVVIDDLCEIVSADQLTQRVQSVLKNCLDVFATAFGLLECGGDETLNDAGHRPAFRASARGDVPGQFAVERPRLAATSVESAVGIQVGRHGDETLFQRDGAYKTQEEG